MLVIEFWCHQILMLLLKQTHQSAAFPKVVAVSWGPQAKPLVADIACRGTQARDRDLTGPGPLKAGPILRERNGFMDGQQRLLQNLIYLYITQICILCVYMCMILYTDMYRFWSYVQVLQRSCTGFEIMLYLSLYICISISICIYIYIYLYIYIDR